MKECPICKRELEDRLSVCPFDYQPLVSRDPFIGVILGDKYRIEEKIAEGATGKVYRATHIPMNRMVAVKIFHSHLISSRTAFEQLVPEARAAARIRHPNAATVIDICMMEVENHKNVYYLVMEFVEGENLRDILRREKQLDYEETVKIFGQICSAVHTAHKNGIIHRDLKPDNIRILKTKDHGSMVKVLDFGSAKLKSGSDIRTGLTTGTSQYMSPEQRRGEKLGSGSDVYSLGVILYEMLTGHLPFQGPTPIAGVRKRNAETPKPLREWRPDIPARAEKVVMRALEKRPENRQKSAVQLAKELKSAFKQNPTSSTTTPPPPVIDNFQKEAQCKSLDGIIEGIFIKEAKSFKPHSVEDLKRLTRKTSSQVRTTRGNAKPATRSDLVDCTVFAPPTVLRGEAFIVQVFTHLPEQAEAAARLAREFDAEAERRAVKSLEASIALGSKLTLHLTGPGLEVDQPVQQFTWRGLPTSVQFGVTVPRKLKQGVIIGTLTVSQKAIPIGHLKFKITIADERKQVAGELLPAGVEARLYKKVFVSYASQDRGEVMKRVQMLSHLHIDFFQDVLDLEPGARWEKELYRHIDESDLFLLFWSSAAKQSRWVMKEVRYALDRKGGDDLSPPEIMPVPIEGPPQPVPPKELSHLHFKDYLLYFVTGSQ